MNKIKSTQNKKMKKINFFEKSVELDKIIHKNLTSILLNDFSFDNKNDKNCFSENEICEKNIPLKDDFTQKNINTISKIFSKVNKERIFFRDLVKKLFKKKFWQIKLKKKSSEIFLNKIDGINNEILSVRIEKLEEESEKLKDIIKKNIGKIEHLVKLNEDMTDEVGKTKNELKNYIMKENVEDGNKIRRIRLNSSNNLFNFDIKNNSTEGENKIHSKRKKRKTHFYYDLKKKSENFNISISDGSARKYKKKGKRLFKTNTLNKIF